ncbi:hypothetical protein [Streptomyces sp. ST2-7A]|uniref:hypothetical protein n=1 Tax=Streptomyces sp. ST2-7A TaxID=2907214 RepID=UPI001F36FA26|nr:hypothetical protein [Streptomyces sp. ST2-7A]MCE7078904.1 hypothetical protein [Streptomyces sp. ST2-7A]
MHRSVRLAAPAAAAVAALLLSACGGDGGNGDAAAETGSGEETAQPDAEEATDAADAGETDEPAGDDAVGGSEGEVPTEYQAIWTASDGSEDTLYIVDGEAMLDGDGGALFCTGTARAAGDGVALALLCMNPDTRVPEDERGGLATLNGDALDVRWEDGDTVGYAKTLDLSGTALDPGMFENPELDLGDLDLGDLGAEFDFGSGN